VGALLGSATGTLWGPRRTLRVSRPGPYGCSRAA
jgi:hypothetical protein